MLAEKRIGEVTVNIQINEFDDKTLEFTKGKFQEFVRTGVIIDGTFDDSQWTLTNEKDKFLIDFTTDEFQVRTIAKKRNIEYSQFVADMKQYIVMWLGMCDLKTIQHFVFRMLKETVQTEFFFNTNTLFDKYKASDIKYLFTFIQMEHIASDEYKDVMRKLMLSRYEQESIEHSRSDNRCKLNEFDSYFLFDFLIRKFWKENKNTKLRYYYFPLYLYWVVTTILPQRVTEFCVIPYDCIRKEDDKCYLTIRRSALKGSGAGYSYKERDYHIDTDYITTEYEIPEWLYDLFAEYQDATSAYDRKYNTLFHPQFMTDNSEYSYLSREQDVFDSKMMNVLLKNFYSDIIITREGYTVINEAELMNRHMINGSYEVMDNEIMYLQLKHTRHLALINLNLRGVNPMVIKEFSGHESSEMAYHYGGNTSNLVRCAVKRVYDLSKKHSDYLPAISIGLSNISALTINEENRHIEMDAGYCYSEKMIAGCLDDCLCAGSCETCNYYREKQAFTKKIHVIRNIEQQINTEAEFVRKLLYDPKFDEKIENYEQAAHHFQTDIAVLINEYIKQEEENNAKKA